MIEKDYQSLAITKLAPNAEWSMVDRNYAEIVWHKIDITPPTIELVNATIEQIKSEEKTVAQQELTDKAAAQEKLAALGLTADDLKALGL